MRTAENLGLFKKKFFYIPIVITFIIVLFCYFAKISFDIKNVLGYVHEISLVITGLFVFNYGHKQHLKKKLIENIPTSKIRSVAMGFSEVNGLAKQKFPLKSSLTHTDCVYYKFTIEREKTGNKGHKYWVLTNSGQSTTYFYVQDGNDKLLVDPLNAEIIIEPDYRFTDIEGSRFGQPSRVRFTEWYIKPDDYIYILGSVKKFKDSIIDRKDKLLECLRKLKENKEKLKEFDLNKDGNINAEEWDKVREKAEQELIEEELKNPQMPEDDLVIAKGDSEKTLIISDRSEKEIVKKLLFNSILLFLIAFILIVIISTSFLARSHLLPNSLVIHWGKFYRL
ncbi:MAG: hypothetical protein A2539_02110 [Elusimicrobia bacterium RIFOXYD2_FULL_34_15]|nr:MAG: hypothetical protein A2539_02110 [Elusimicrobia bacterium RIFOXYD2_FULL_34_15]